MKSGATHSLQGRLLALLLGLMVLVWSVTGVATWLDVRHELDELLDSHLAQAAALLVVQQSPEVDDDDHRPDAPVLHRYAPKVAFQVWHEGQLVLHSADAPDLAPQGPRDDFRTGFRTVRYNGQDWRVFATYGGERDVQVYVAEQVASRTSIVRAVLRSLFWPMVLALPVLALAAWWAVSHGLKPLRQLGRLLHERDPRALQPVDLPEHPREMTPVVEALNTLFTRIDDLMTSERRFTSDASHELRTPIAAVRMQAQVALAEDDPQRRRHALKATLEGCDRATRLVDQLLTLSRLETGQAPPTQDLRLVDLVRQTIADLGPEALRRHQDLAMEASSDAVVRADPTLLTVLVRNLVDNALRYSPEGARIRVQVEPSPQGVSLTVSDSGPGLSPADRARLGERFFRVLGSDRDGSGLGWSIVRRIADAFGASVHVGPSPDLGGLEVCIGFRSVA